MKPHTKTTDESKVGVGGVVGVGDSNSNRTSVTKTNQSEQDVVKEEEEAIGSSKSKCWDKNSLMIYSSHFLSSFGDRIWQFAVGLYLYYLYPCSLLLTAVYGFVTSISLFLLGAPLGRWVDKSKRLKAARITIVVQNACVVICATIMASAIYYKAEMKEMWEGKLEFLVYATIIIVEIVSELASMANKLVLEKDWIVVLARGDKQKLSSLNATMRTINLSCKILAPFVVGHLFDIFSYLTGAIFIASWNVISAVCEYYLLYVIFSLVPELATKKDSKEGTIVETFAPKAEVQNPKENLEIVPIHSPLPRQQSGGDQATSGLAIETNNNGHHPGVMVEIPLNDDATSDKVDGDAPTVTRRTSISVESNSADFCSCNCRCNIQCCGCGGWRTYFTHHVKFAGLGLAFLYMTVLSFDNVTVGYLATQGVSASVVGNMTAVSALVGILGSLSFPYFRKKLGKSGAGLVGFGLETMCLLLCVISIWAKGSPFEPQSISKILEDPPACRNKTGMTTSTIAEQWKYHTNIFFLMAGVVLARYGLWIADLSVTQTFQEKVHESKRGVMGGVQAALNQLMSLMKFGLTMVLPYPETFGYLICLSWSFVFLGWVLFSIFVCQDKRRKNQVGVVVLE